MIRHVVFDDEVSVLPYFSRLVLAAMHPRFIRLTSRCFASPVWSWIEQYNPPLTTKVRSNRDSSRLSPGSSRTSWLKETILTRYSPQCLKSVGEAQSQPGAGTSMIPVEPINVVLISGDPRAGHTDFGRAQSVCSPPR